MKKRLTKPTGKQKNKPRDKDHKQRRAESQESSSAKALRESLLLRIVLFVVAAMLAAVYVYLQSPRLPGTDGFYHIGHARLYAEAGPFIKEFPWVSCSVISKFAADIWYGFHLLIVPVTFIQDPLFRIKVAGIIILSSLLVLFYFAMRKCRMDYPFLWPFVLLVPFVWRLAMPRPHIISMGLSALLYSFMLNGSVLAVFLCSAALTFFHLTFFWVAILVALIVTAIKFRTENIFEWKKLAAVPVGLMVGWLLRPNPLGAAKILHAQLFELLAQRGQGQLIFGGELAPLRISELLAVFTPFLIIWLGCCVIIIAGLLLRSRDLPGQRRTLLWSSLIVSGGYFLLTIGMSTRSADQWAPFSVIAIAAAFTSFLSLKESEPRALFGRESRIFLVFVAGLVSLVMAWQSLGMYSRHMARTALLPDRLQAVGEWLGKNARPGEIVFHTRWDLFPELFYWNPQNHYIGGMDPIFQYVYSPDLYWKAHHLYTGRAAAKTWGTDDPKGVGAEDTYTVLQRDFKASYLFIEKQRERELYAYAARDQRFSLRYDDGSTAVFELASPTPAESITDRIRRKRIHKAHIPYFRKKP